MRPPLRAGAPLPAGTTVSAVIPARDEAARIGPCVLAARADPGVSEVIVVDDESTDGTAAAAARAGARVIPGLPLPAGWVGKQWALQQGLEVASGEYVLTLDADTRPRPGLAAALVTAATGALSTWSARAPGSSATARPNRACTRPCWPPWSTGSARSGRTASQPRTAWWSTGSACWPAGPGWPPRAASRRSAGTSPTTSRWPGTWPGGAGGSAFSTGVTCWTWTCTRP